MPSGTPIAQRLQADIPAPSAANAAQSKTIGEAQVAGVVTSVTITPNAALTADATDYRTFAVANKGADGSAGSDLTIATFATDTPTTDDLVAFDEKSLPLSGTAANLVVAEGDIIAAVETVAGSGVAHSGYSVVVEIARS